MTYISVDDYLSQMPFQKTTHTSVSRRIHAPKEKILKLLHDPLKFYPLNPLVSDVKPHEEIPDRWIITDVLSFACWKKILEYHAHSKLHEDGITSEVTAHSMGFKVVTTSKFVVKEVEEGICDVVEDGTIDAHAILMPYIMGTQSSAHEKLMDKLKETLEME